MKSPTPYEAELDGRRKAVHDARQHVILLEAELRGFEAAAAFLTRTTSPAEADNAGVDHRVGIRGNWRAILTATALHYPAPTTLDDFIRIADDLGTPTTRNTLRSQMSIYSNAGYLERVGQGEYRLTEKGADMLGVTLRQLSTASDPDRSEAVMGGYSIADSDGRIEDGQHDETKEDAMHTARTSPLL